MEDLNILQEFINSSQQQGVEDSMQLTKVLKQLLNKNIKINVNQRTLNCCKCKLDLQDQQTYCKENDDNDAPIYHEECFKQRQKEIEQKEKEEQERAQEAERIRLEEEERNAPKLQCDICFDEFSIQKIITYGQSIIEEGQTQCSHKSCITCLKNYIYEKLKQMKYRKNYTLDIPCMTESCTITMDPNVILTNFVNLYEEINLNCIYSNNEHYKAIHQIYKKNIIIKCQKCENVFMYEEQNTKFTISIKCQKCQNQICSNCQESYHGNKNCKNPYIFKKNILEQLQSNIKKEESETIIDIRLCPNPKCETPYMNPMGCDHADCQECQWAFCFKCSVIRNPIMAHNDNSYHREGCPHYSLSDGNYMCKSQECQKISCQSDYESQKKCISSSGHYCIECHNKNIKIEKIEDHTVCSKPESYKFFKNSIYEKYNIGKETNYDKVIRKYLQNKKKKEHKEYNFEELIQELENNKQNEINPPKKFQEFLNIQYDDVQLQY